MTTAHPYTNTFTSFNQKMSGSNAAKKTTNSSDVYRMDCGEVSIEQRYQSRDDFVVQMGGNIDLDKGGSDGGGKKWPH